MKDEDICKIICPDIYQECPACLNRGCPDREGAKNVAAATEAQVRAEYEAKMLAMINEIDTVFVNNRELTEHSWQALKAKYSGEYDKIKVLEAMGVPVDRCSIEVGVMADGHFTGLYMPKPLREYLEGQKMTRLFRFIQNLSRGLDIHWAWTLSQFKSKRIK